MEEKKVKRYLRDLQGFTLLELILVVASIAILTATLVVTILGLLEDAKGAKHKPASTSACAGNTTDCDDIISLIN